MILQNCRPLQGANYFWGSWGAPPIHLGLGRVILEVLSDFSLKGREISWIVESLPYWERSCGFSCEIMCFTHVSACVCVCVCVCAPAHVYTSKCVCVCTRTQACTCVVCVCTCTCVYIWVCMCVHIYGVCVCVSFVHTRHVCMQLCVCTWARIYTCTHVPHVCSPHIHTYKAQ